MRNVVKIFNRICLIVTIIVSVICIVAAKTDTARIVIGILLAIKVMISTTIYETLQNNKKFDYLGIIALFFLHPVVGILYLCWEPNKRR